jgi:hypothetical protein
VKYRRLVPVVFGLLLFSFLSAGSAPAQVETLKVSEMTITTRIARRNPVDSVRRISAASEKTLYCYTRLAAPDDEERRISHVWYRNGEVTAEYVLPVRGTRWRTHSKKVIEKGMRGLWRVEALDDEGNLLKSVEFTMY